MSDLKAFLKAHPYKGPFKPVPFFSVVGNMLVIHFEDERAYAESLSQQVTVLRSFKDKRIIGVKLFEIPELIESARAKQ